MYILTISRCAQCVRFTHWAFKICFSTQRVGTWVTNHVFHQVLDVGGPEVCLVWPAGESEGGVPAGAWQQCMIISLVLWSGFCSGPAGPWPLTSNNSRITIPLCWSSNSPSISLLFIGLRPLSGSAGKRFTTDCRGEDEYRDCQQDEIHLKLSKTWGHKDDIKLVTHKYRIIWVACMMKPWSYTQLSKENILYVIC